MNSSITFEAPSAVPTCKFFDITGWLMDDWMGFIEAHPYSNQDVFDHLKTHENKNFIIEFFHAYYMTHHQFPHFFNDPVSAIEWMLPEQRESLVKEYPEIFLALIESSNEYQKKEIFKKFDQGNFCEIFAKGFSGCQLEICYNIDCTLESEPDHPAYLFIQFLLDVTSDEQQKQMIDYFNEHLPILERGFFLLILRDLLKEGYFSFICQCEYFNNITAGALIADFFLIMQLPFAKERQQVFIREMLDYFFCEQEFKDCLFHEFFIMGRDQQIYFLELFGAEERNTVFQASKDSLSLLAEWCDLFFKNNDFFEERKKFLSCLCLQIDSVDRLKYFIDETRYVNKTICGYLFYCLPEQIFEGLVNETDEYLLKKILSEIEADHSIFDFLAAWDSHPFKEHLNEAMTLKFKWNENAVDDLEYNEDIEMYIENSYIEERFTIKNYREKLCLLYQEPELIPFHEAIIQNIPPLLIAIWAKDEQFQSTLFFFAKHFTNNQLQFLMLRFQNNFYNAIHLLSDHHVRLDQLIGIFSRNDLVWDFFIEKTEDLKKSLIEFDEKMEEFQRSMNSLFLECQSLEIRSNTKEEQQLACLEVQLLELRSLCIKSEHIICQALNKFLEESESKEFFDGGFKAFKETRHALNQKKMLVNEHSEIRKTLNQIENLINKDEAMSIVELLPEWFWILFRSEDVKFFKAINHFEELQQVGISSGEDLFYLGVTAEQESSFKNILAEILSSYEKNEKKTIDELLQKWLRIDLDEEETDKVFNDLIAAMVEPITIVGMKKILNSVYKGVVSFELVSENDKLFLKKEKKEIGNLGLFTLIKGEDFLRKLMKHLSYCHPRIALQEYLAQDDLKDIWEGLHLEGFQSIKDLIEKKQLNASDLFALK